MAKRPSISTISSGYASTTTLNDNFEALQEAFDNTISRDGSTPNTMSADLDMNGNDIIGASSVLVGGVDYLAQSLAYKNAAETAKTAAEAAKVAAELAYDNFDDRYLGVKTSDPSTDNDGNALLDGALFFDTTLNVMKVYDQGNTSWKRTTPTTSEQANIDTVTGISSDVTTVAGVSANVTTVADSIADVNSVATNMAEVLTADTNAATATTKAAEASASATAAANSATSASGSATTASNQATAAATSASTSTTQAGISTTKATESAASAVAALASKNAAATSETNASGSAGAALNFQTQAGIYSSNAASSASSALSSKNSASSFATNSANSATSASNSASTATTKASEAAASATSAAASYDSFDDRYLGVKTTAPSTDNDGDALTTGCLYYNSTVGQLYIWDGSAWDDAALSASGAVTAFNTRTGSVTLNSTDVLNASGLLNTGGTMTGALVLNADPSVALGAATKQYVDTEVAGIVDSAPATLDTLNELAAALGDDANFSTTVTNNIATKVSKSGDTMTGNLDVQGTVTADGLTVDGNVALENADFITFKDTGGANRGILTLDVNNDIVIGPAGAGIQDIKLKNNGAKTRLNIDVGGDLSLYEDTGTTPKFFWDASAEKLEIGSIGGGADGLLAVKTNANNHAIAIEEASGVEAYAIGVESDGSLGFYNSGSTTASVTFDDSGNVGIATTDPVENLTVGATTTTAGFSLGAADTQVFLRYNNYFSGTSQVSDATKGSASISLGRGSDGVITFNTAAAGAGTPSETMRIDSSGNLLVGQSSSTQPGVGNTTNGFAIRNDGLFFSSAYQGRTGTFGRNGNDGPILGFYKDGSTVGSIGTSGGDIGLTTSANARSVYIGGANSGGSARYLNFDLDVQAGGSSSGNEGGACFSSVDDVTDLGTASNRFHDLYLSGTANAANFNTTSDATLKTNVETLTGSLDVVKALRGVSFDWIGNGGSEVGVIAQEVEAVLPDVVSTDYQGIKSVKYSNMVAVLIEAIKEQQLRIEALEARLGE